MVFRGDFQIFIAPTKKARVLMRFGEVGLDAVKRHAGALKRPHPGKSGFKYGKKARVLTRLGGYGRLGFQEERCLFCGVGFF